MNLTPWLCLIIVALLIVIAVLWNCRDDLKREVKLNENRINSEKTESEAFRHANEKLHEKLVNYEEALTAARQKRDELQEANLVLAKGFERAEYFESLLPVTVLDGIGEATAKKLKSRYKITNISQIAKTQDERWNQIMQKVLPQKSDYLNIKAQAVKIMGKA